MPRDEFSHFLMTRRTLLKNTAAGFAAFALASGMFCPALAAPGKTLTLFYSWSGNTRSVARRIHKRIGGDLAEIIPARPYPEDYNACVDQAKKELAANFFPPIQPVAADLAQYSVILLGSPNWWSSWSGPVRTFLHENSLDGKTVLPFNTHGGGGWQNMLCDLKAFCPKAAVREGLAIRDGQIGQAGAQIDGWLKKTGLLS